MEEGYELLKGEALKGRVGALGVMKAFEEYHNDFQKEVEGGHENG